MKNHSTSPYPLLDQLVSGRRVAVVAKNPKCRDMTFPGQLVARFNNDGGQADIWATRLHHGMNLELHESCSLVVIPRVESRESVKRDLERLEHPITKPTQFELEEHFEALKAHIGAPPTTGLLLLAMLSRTSMEACTLYGFDAHITPDPRVDMKGFAVHHAPVKELRYLRRLLRNDPRFQCGKHCSLVWPEVVWLTALPVRFLMRELPEVLKFLRRHGLRETLRRTVYVLGQRIRKQQTADHGDEGNRKVELVDE